MGNLSLSKLLVLYDELTSILDTTGDIDIVSFTKGLEKNNYDKEKFKKLFPSLTTRELNNLLTILKIEKDNNQNKANKIEFVGTVPSDIDTDLRQTISVVRQIILEAEESILITGYSISEFINEIIELLLFKSQKGIKVRFFIDKGINIKTFLDMKLINKNFKIYKFKKNLSYSSLHAKVMVIDDKKAFVSSSNLSYNGIVNNIEIGTLVTGEKVVSITKLFETLLKNEMFNELS